MRTTAEEYAAIGRRMAEILATATRQTVVLLPEGGVSALDAPGQPFHDPEADAALFEAIRRGLDGRRARPGRVASRDAHQRPGLRRPRGAPAPGTHAPTRSGCMPTMTTTMTREAILERFRDKVAAGPADHRRRGRAPGLSAKCAEAGGIDLIIIYNSGRFRMAGRGSLAGLMPYGDANAIVMEMAREVLPVVEQTPVLAGVCGTDPFRVMARFLRRGPRRRVRRGPELPDRRPDRRHLPPGARRDGDGLRQGGRHDRRGPRPRTC